MRVERISRLVRHVFGFGAYSRTPSPDILSIAQCLRQKNGSAIGANSEPGGRAKRLLAELMLQATAEICMIYIGYIFLTVV